jgi:hypothetical protein
MTEIKPENEEIIISKNENLWFDTEENYLNMLSIKYEELADQYMLLYEGSFKKQTGFRLPAIALSSISGIFSFGSSSFPTNSQKYVSIGVGIINIFIAMLQTFESYFKVNDIVVKSLNVSLTLRKLSDKIHCELCIPVANRTSSGDQYLRDIQNEYEKVISDAPPLVFDDNPSSCCKPNNDNVDIRDKYNKRGKSLSKDIYESLRDKINEKYQYLNHKVIIEEKNEDIKPIESTTRKIINV